MTRRERKTRKRKIGANQYFLDVFRKWNNSAMRCKRRKRGIENHTLLSYFGNETFKSICFLFESELC